MRATLLAIPLVTALSCAAGPPAREISLAMTEYGFVPTTIELRAGERVRLVVRNIGRLEHDLAPDGRARAFGFPHVHLQPGGVGGANWTAPAKPDELEVLCTITGHQALGMAARVLIR